MDFIVRNPTKKDVIEGTINELDNMLLNLERRIDYIKKSRDLLKEYLENLK